MKRASLTFQLKLGLAIQVHQFLDEVKSVLLDQRSYKPLLLDNLHQQNGLIRLKSKSDSLCSRIRRCANGALFGMLL